jgi:dipeptidyl aminopeptidase/acylaminoacyl peptidase
MYLVDGLSGVLKRQITRGSWVVRDVPYFDEDICSACFLAGGMEPGQDPYYRHLYRVSIDSGELAALTPEVGDHDTVFSPSGRYFVDCCGQADGSTVTTLRRANGEIVCDLETGDFSALLARGWRFPEPFQFIARDGVTDLYGTILFPTDFDLSQKYPVLDDTYGWNQMIHVLKTYPEDGYGLYDYWMPQALAELGFIVVLMDGMGTTYRSKTFHDVSYKNQADGGLPDHILGLRKLAAERPYMDLGRVGIYGHSGGGFNTARALLKYPDFFHVGVSSASPHDLRLYIPMSDETEAEIKSVDNTILAGNLRGKLLLMHGELDDNVHPSSTLKLVNALIEANADFDLLIQPNRNHNNCMDPYYVRRLWDYFVTYLGGKTPPRGYRIAKPGGEFMATVETVPPADNQD